MTALINENDNRLEEALQELLSKHMRNPEFKLSELSTSSVETLGISDPYNSRKSFKRILVNLNCNNTYSELIKYWVAELSIKLCSKAVRNTLMTINKEFRRTGVFSLNHEAMSELQVYQVESNRDMFPAWIKKIENAAGDDLNQEFQLFKSRILNYLDIIKLRDIIRDIRDDLVVISNDEKYKFTEKCFAFGLNELISDFLTDEDDTAKSPIKLPAIELTSEMVSKFKLDFINSGPYTLREDAINLIYSAYKLRRLENMMRIGRLQWTE